LIKARSIEDILETEIDPRLPSSFKSWDVLSVRQEGFKYYIHHNGDKNEIVNVPNWEIFVYRYFSEEVCNIWLTSYYN
jgi:hypothetical protein